MTTKTHVIKGFLFCTVALTANAIAQVWDYQAWNATGPTELGTITLSKTADGPTVRKMAGRLSNACDSHNVPAKVEENSDAIVITTEPKIVGCLAERYSIKADGSGGTRFTKSGEEWVQDGRDRKLTLRK